MIDAVIYIALDLVALAYFIASLVMALQGQFVQDYLQTGLLFAILGCVYSIRDQHKRCQVTILFKEDKR